MFILTARVTKEKLVIALLAVAAVIALLVVLLGGGGEDTAGTLGPTNLTGDDNGLSYIGSLGWVVDETPVETMEVRVPEDNSEVFEKYNDLQKSQGFDLADYSGKRVKKTTYEVLNYPTGEEGVYLTLFIYKDKIIGGDVSSSAKGGFMHGLSMPEGSDTGKTAALSGEADAETMAGIDIEQVQNASAVSGDEQAAAVDGQAAEALAEATADEAADALAETPDETAAEVMTEDSAEPAAEAMADTDTASTAS